MNPSLPRGITYGRQLQPALAWLSSIDPPGSQRLSSLMPTPLPPPPLIPPRYSPIAKLFVLISL